MRFYNDPHLRSLYIAVIIPSHTLARQQEAAIIHPLVQQAEIILSNTHYSKALQQSTAIHNVKAEHPTQQIAIAT